jgi:hypothetical protein
MKNFIEVYSFQVFETIKEGKEVYCVDKELRELFLINTITTQMFSKILKESAKKENYNRFIFYYIEEGEPKDGNI